VLWLSSSRRPAHRGPPSLQHVGSLPSTPGAGYLRRSAHGGDAEVSATGTARGGFGELLRSYRRSAALTQEELADLAQLSPRAIWDLERGRRQRPRRSTVDGLIRALPLDAMQARLLAAAARPGLARAAEQAAQEADGAHAEPAARRHVQHEPGSPARLDGVLAGTGRWPVPLPAPPAQLPHGTPAFTGREPELARLGGLARAEPRGSSPVICLIDGPPGAGKTTLAVRFAHRVADQYPDGQLYANLRGFDHDQTPLPPQDALGRMLQDLGVRPSRVPASPDGRAGMFRTVLAGRRMLIVLDNAASASQVRPLLPGHPGCLVLVTSRNRLRGLTARDGAERITLGTLTPADSLTLLARMAGPDRIDADPPAAAALARQCGYLPLALAIIADSITCRPGVSLAGLAGELADETDRLDALAVEGDPSAGVRAAISWSYRTLAPEPARLFRRLGLHPGPYISLSAAAAAAGTDTTAARQLLDQLTSAHLLEESGHGRYEFHDLLRLYAAEQSNTEHAAMPCRGLAPHEAVSAAAPDSPRDPGHTTTSAAPAGGSEQ
jgi:transcriptional regulator with XRE-family HTH domain